MREWINFLSDEGLAKTLNAVTENPNCVLFVSLPCTSGCYFNVAINNKIPSAQKKISMNKREFEALWARFEILCRLLEYNVPIVFEWPRHNVLWRIPKVKRLLDRLGCMMTDFDGCAFGLRSIRKGFEHRFLKKPWAFATNIPDVCYAFRSCCSGVCKFHQHDETRG